MGTRTVASLFGLLFGFRLLGKWEVRCACWTDSIARLVADHWKIFSSYLGAGRLMVENRVLDEREEEP